MGGHTSENYALSLFVGVPFALGLTSVLLFGFSRPQPFSKCVLLAFGALGLACLALFGFTVEGAICLIMSAPMFLFPTFLGAWVGYIIQSRPWLNDHTASIVLLLAAVLPTLMAAEHVQDHQEQSNNPDRLHTVGSTVVLDASPEQVWDALLTLDVSVRLLIWVASFSLD